MNTDFRKSLFNFLKHIMQKRYYLILLKFFWDFIQEDRHYQILITRAPFKAELFTKSKLVFNIFCHTFYTSMRPKYRIFSATKMFLSPDIHITNRAFPEILKNFYINLRSTFLDIFYRKMPYKCSWKNAVLSEVDPYHFWTSVKGI